MKLVFTKKDVIVLLFCILIFFTCLGTIGKNGRQRAKEIVCLSNLQKWGSIFDIHTKDNNGYFLQGFSFDNRWMATMKDYYVDIKMRLCPMATIPMSEGGITPYAAWGRFDDSYGSYGSYGFNYWLVNQSISEDQSGNYWGNIHNIEETHKVPVFLDCFWYDVWPHEYDIPPAEASDNVGAGSNEMKRVCLDRHNAAINGLFADWSARKIGLKELWTLKWHRNFNMAGPWTRAGGVQSQDWPIWMREFKEY